jgi:hypothetical protein
MWRQPVKDMPRMAAPWRKHHLEKQIHKRQNSVFTAP